MKTINIYLDDKEHEDLTTVKKKLGLTWKEILHRGAK